LRKEYSVRVDVLTEWREAEAEFERFVEQHTRQWRAEGKPGHFGAWPKAREFNRALVQAHAKLGRVRFIRLFANDEVIAGQYAYAFGDAYYWELPSREVDAKWERFSLGPTAIVVMIETAMNEGKARLEGGLAHYDYKLRLGAKEHAVKTWRIYRSRPAVRLKIFAYGLLRDALQLVYQKLWRRRLAPHLPPRFWRPQWSRWLGLDF
jgi:CelD/BcsL family acetyltransferase involved in cellulose biosynthesis